MNETYKVYKQGENIGYRQALLDLSVIILSKEYSTLEIVEIIDNLKSIKENEFNNI